MSTTRRDKGESIFNNLKPEQRARMDGWLFDDKHTYKQVAEEMQRVFGLRTSVTGVSRYYHSRNRARKLDGLERGAQKAGGMDNAPQEMYESVLGKIESMALEMAGSSREEVKTRDLAELVHLLIAARREANEASRVALAREKLEYDVATACLMHKIEMDRICEDNSMDDGERIQAIREELFGPNLPE